MSSVHPLVGCRSLGFLLFLLVSPLGASIRGNALLLDGFESGATCAWTIFVSPVIPGGCFIDGVCYDPGEPDPSGGGCRACSPLDSQTSWTTTNEGGLCDDGDACTTGDQCVQGACTPSGVDPCDDSISCTVDSCESPTGCVHAAQDILCDDAISCTLNTCSPTNDCETTILAGFCLIAASCYDDGDLNPGNVCSGCQSAIDNTVFTDLPAGTQCAPGSCASGSTANPPDQCNGSGVCVDAGTVQCSPYICSSSACLTSCATSAQCATGNYCNAPSCVPKKANGQACGGPDQCVSNQCVDGVCCESACGGVCERCAVGTGACNAVSSGSDPDAECAQDPASTCDQDGFCSGNRSCRLWAAGTQCVAPVCGPGDFPTTSNPADACNGTGTCLLDSTFVDCGNYLCNSSTGNCRTSCQFDFECDAGFVCSGSPGNPGSCV